LLLQVCYGQPLKVKDFGFNNVTEAVASIPDAVKFSQGKGATTEVLLKSAAVNPQMPLQAIVPTAMKQKIEAIIRDEYVEGATLDEIALTYMVQFFA
jgi:hypothetical protein